jgi:hypothetical protein
MESVLKFLDDLDDLQAFLRVQARPVIVTLLLLLIACAAIFAGALVFGSPELHAAP